MVGVCDICERCIEELMFAGEVVKARPDVEVEDSESGSGVVSTKASHSAYQAATADPNCTHNDPWLRRMEVYRFDA